MHIETKNRRALKRVKQHVKTKCETKMRKQNNRDRLHMFLMRCSHFVAAGTWQLHQLCQLGSCLCFHQQKGSAHCSKCLAIWEAATL